MAGRKTLAITDKQFAVLRVLWEQGALTVRQLMGHLPGGERQPYTTTLGLLQTMEKIGLVRHEEEGRGHRYIAGVLPQAARKSALKHLTDKLFKGSSELLFTHLVSDQKLTPEQVRRMRQLLAGKDGDAKDAGAKADAHTSPPSETQRRKER